MKSDSGTPRIISVGVTGHRKFGSDPRVPWYVHAQCVLVLDHLLRQARLEDASLVAYSALAIGADSHFAEAAVGLGIPLIGVIPFSDYPRDFDRDELPRFETLLGLCHSVQRLPGKLRSDRGYLKAGQWIADRVQYLVAVWNGLPAAGVGGTGDIVAYARKKRRAVLCINPADVANQAPKVVPSA